MTDKFLDKAYGLDTAAGTRDFYDQWSKTYEHEVGEAGYATPKRLARALAKFVRKDATILDFGCGTGLSGLALKAQGFTTIDGVDVSEEMLQGAREKGIYRALSRIDPTETFQLQEQAYDAIIACGVIGSGAAPLSVFDSLMSLLKAGDYIAFSFNDHTLEDRSFEARVNDYIDGGSARLLLREYGPHLPGIGMKSMVYVMEKT